MTLVGVEVRLITQEQEYDTINQNSGADPATADR